jgi:hypothetical protein
MRAFEPDMAVCVREMSTRGGGCGVVAALESQARTSQSEKGRPFLRQRGHTTTFNLDLDLDVRLLKTFEGPYEELQETLLSSIGRRTPNTEYTGSLHITPSCYGYRYSDLDDVEGLISLYLRSRTLCMV